MSVIKSTLTTATTGLNAVNNLFSAAEKLTRAADTLAGVADTKATNIAALISIQDQMKYSTAKAALDAQLASLAPASKK